jgi:DNA-binding IscR family transcriptional regulator
VVDGGFTETSCTHGAERRGRVCVEGEGCGLKQLWQDVQGAVEHILFATSFEEVRKRTLAGVTRQNDLAQLKAQM